VAGKIKVSTQGKEIEMKDIRFKQRLEDLGIDWAKADEILDLAYTELMGEEVDKVIKLEEDLKEAILEAKYIRGILKDTMVYLEKDLTSKGEEDETKEEYQRYVREILEGYLQDLDLVYKGLKTIEEVGK